MLSIAKRSVKKSSAVDFCDGFFVLFFGICFCLSLCRQLHVSRLLSCALGVSLEHLDGLLDLGGEGLGGLEEVEKLTVVHLEKHAGNLSGELGLGGVNKRV